MWPPEWLVAQAPFLPEKLNDLGESQGFCYHSEKLLLFQQFLSLDVFPLMLES